MNDCIFCKIVNGDIPCYKVWEDEDFLAFLSINPPAEGLTLVRPKKHQPSYFAHVDNTVLSELIKRAKVVAEILDTKLEGVMRTKLVLEGLEVDHLHAKLYPMYKNREESFRYSKVKATPKDLEGTHLKLTS
ncbi:MAG: HIT domain-containing protein [Patescibacteria group bacterium]|jgi:diadenosine tetraphosphate (Ap4A) HIT family hydrolase